MRSQTYSAIVRRSPARQLDSLISISRIRHCRDTSPAKETLTIRELIERFLVPKTDSGKLNSESYHALNKEIKEEKAIMAREKDGQR